MNTAPAATPEATPEGTPFWGFGILGVWNHHESSLIIGVDRFTLNHKIGIDRLTHHLDELGTTLELNHRDEADGSQSWGSRCF